MALTFLFDGPEQAKHTILLAHGAGAPMELAGSDIDGEGSGWVGLSRGSFRIRLYGLPADGSGPQAASAS